jgi:hypothetical protein
MLLKVLQLTFVNSITAFKIQHLRRVSYSYSKMTSSVADSIIDRSAFDREMNLVALNIPAHSCTYVDIHIIFNLIYYNDNIL